MKNWLDKVSLACKVYNETRLHTNFQEEEVLNFVEFLHKTYGYEYAKPMATHQNTPERLALALAKLK